MNELKMRRQLRVRGVRGGWAKRRRPAGKQWCASTARQRYVCVCVWQPSPPTPPSLQSPTIRLVADSNRLCETARWSACCWRVSAEWSRDVRTRARLLELCVAAGWLAEGSDDSVWLCVAWRAADRDVSSGRTLLCGRRLVRLRVGGKVGGLLWESSMCGVRSNEARFIWKYLLHAYRVSFTNNKFSLPIIFHIQLQILSNSTMFFLFILFKKILNVIILRKANLI